VDEGREPRASAIHVTYIANVNGGLEGRGPPLQVTELVGAGNLWVGGYGYG